MQNTAVNTHDATNSLSPLMCVVAYCSLTCTENPINMVLNNPHGLSTRCGTWRSTLIMQRIDYHLKCVLLHTIHSHAYVYHINMVLNNPRGLGAWCRTLWSILMMQRINYRLKCALLHTLHSHAYIYRMNVVLNNPRRLGVMWNTMVNTHDAKDSLSPLTCDAARCSLTCIENSINVVLNNLRGLGAQCKIVRSTLMMQRTDCHL